MLLRRQTLPREHVLGGTFAKAEEKTGKGFDCGGGSGEFWVVSAKATIDALGHCSRECLLNVILSSTEKSTTEALRHGDYLIFPLRGSVVDFLFAQTVNSPCYNCSFSTLPWRCMFRFGVTP